MESPRPIGLCLSWLHRRPATDEDGVYRDAVTPFSWLSLILTEPIFKAVFFGLFSSILVALFLCVYVGAFPSTWLVTVYATSFRYLLPSSLDAAYKFSPPSAPSVSEPALSATSAARVSSGPRQESNVHLSPQSLRSIIREALKAYSPTSAIGRCPFLLGLLESVIFTVVLFFGIRYQRRLASGFSRSSLDEYAARLTGVTPFSSKQSCWFSRPFCFCISQQQKGRKAEEAAAEKRQSSSVAINQNLLEGQVAVVTGATSGIGRETALQLAKWGARVYFGTRSAKEGRLVAAALNQEVQSAVAASARANSCAFSAQCAKQPLLHYISSLCSKLLWTVGGFPQLVNTSALSRAPEKDNAQGSVETTKPRVYYHQLDVCRAASVRDFARWVLAETNGQVDILVNNAGQMHLSKLTPAEFDNKACFEYHHVCNHLGHFLLTQLLLPALKRSAAAAATPSVETKCASTAPATDAGRGRIINLSSVAHMHHTPDFSVLDAAFTHETAAAAAAALAADEISQRQQQPGQRIVSQQQEKDEERRVAERRLQARRQLSAQTYRPWAAYGNSKLCNIWFTKELQRRLLASSTAGEAANESSVGDSSNNRATRRTTEPSEKKSAQGGGKSDGIVGVYAAHPGVVGTRLSRHLVEKNLFYWLVVDVLAPCLALKTPADGAATTLFLCIAPKRTLHWGGYYADGSPSWVVPAALDITAQRDLWIVGESICKRFAASKGDDESAATAAVDGSRTACVARTATIIPPATGSQLVI